MSQFRLMRNPSFLYRFYKNSLEKMRRKESQHNIAFSSCIFLCCNFYREEILLAVPSAESSHRTKTSCQTIGVPVPDHFRDITKMVALDLGHSQEITNIKLTR